MCLFGAKLDDSIDMNVHFTAIHVHISLAMYFNLSSPMLVLDMLFHKLHCCLSVIPGFFNQNYKLIAYHFS